MTQYYRETLFGEIVHGMLYEPDVIEYSHDSMVYMLAKLQSLYVKGTCTMDVLWMMFPVPMTMALGN